MSTWFAYQSTLNHSDARLSNLPAAHQRFTLIVSRFLWPFSPWPGSIHISHYGLHIIVIVDLFTSRLAGKDDENCPFDIDHLKRKSGRERYTKGVNELRMRRTIRSEISDSINGEIITDWRADRNGYAYDVSDGLKKTEHRSELSDAGDNCFLFNDK